MTQNASLFAPAPPTARPYLWPVVAFLASVPFLTYIASHYLQGLPAGVAGIAALAAWPLALFMAILALPPGRS